MTTDSPGRCRATYSRSAITSASRSAGVDDRLHACMIRITANTISRIGLMRRMIRKTKRMPAVHANVLGVATTFRQEAQEVAGDDADGWMAELVDVTRRRLLDAFQEGVSAEACVLFKAVASHHVADTVTEEPAEVAHLLLEGHRRRVRIAPRVE